ncbi:PhzF family phenazine biosynthesis protein [Frigoribacterium sp. PvP032]|uniref:PhzF family phenazine biosynthesis protein n=1 Tax=Frigoribacterium sp. PvP032 TaxID=2806589 RepID=UPI001B7B0F63|nr:PhzF family phenazine biosynthesis protein [Frigoribacterium sp. PvP032]MBP1191561.1 PhzF family phenazine biosynthesis protein [Frigoribacterium sp. PvP032]
MTVPRVPTTASSTDVLRLTAFADGPGGGNPAGAVLDASTLEEGQMQAIAAEVGYAETAFVVDGAVGGDDRVVRTRYFSPIAEVPFCGHATIATAVALAEARGRGAFRFETAVGPVVIETTQEAGAGGEGVLRASFTSVEPRTRPLDVAVADELLGLLGLVRDDVDPGWPVTEAFAGNWHPVVALRSLAVFDAFGFDPGAVRELMDRQGWSGTVTVVCTEGVDLGLAADGSTRRAGTGSSAIEARNLFPVGAVTEDPATGSAAAALGAYLRAVGLLAPPARFTVRQGRHVGRPSLLTVDVPEVGGITVSGTASPVEA